VYVFSSTKSENGRVEEILLGEERIGTSEGASGRERGRRVNMVQIMYTHVCKCKSDTYSSCSRNQERLGEGEQWRR
jgi:hypothetical protein